MNSKSILTVVITAILVGGGVYFWQNQTYSGQQLPKSNSPEAVSQEIPKVTSPEISVVETAKKSESKFLYLVSSPSLEKTQVILKDFYGNFSFEYPWNEWREMYFSTSDLTASGGGDGNRFSEFYTYDFCAGSYGCDMTKQEGRGFEMQIWNATYPGRKDDPNFFKKNGEVFVKETDKIIITYKPYKGQNVAEAAAKLFESFKLD